MHLGHDATVGARSRTQQPVYRDCVISWHAAGRATAKPNRATSGNAKGVTRKVEHKLKDDYICIHVHIHIDTCIYTYIFIHS